MLHVGSPPLPLLALCFFCHFSLYILCSLFIFVSKNSTLYYRLLFMQNLHKIKMYSILSLFDAIRRTVITLPSIKNISANISNVFVLVYGKQ